MTSEFVEYEVDEGVAVITLNRPQAANAQNQQVLMELDELWTRADEDIAVKVIVLRSNGKHFSAGHDMSGKGFSTLNQDIPIPEALYDWETRHYLHYAKRWRDIPKPSIAAVQGKCIAAGLMLCWPCDLIIAADNAEFSDPVAYMGICGVEYHAHTWEFGARKAKELLFTGDSLGAVQAEQIGMVNKVVPLDDLMTSTMALAHRIAKQDTFALRIAKRTVNRTLDIQGFGSAIEACFDMHQLGHMRATVVTGYPSMAGLESMKDKQAVSEKKA
jgi:enoyl-CoA hydratase